MFLCYMETDHATCEETFLNHFPFQIPSGCSEEEKAKFKRKEIVIDVRDQLRSLPDRASEKDINR